MSYTPPTISNYNDDPPPDDGSETVENEVKWSIIKTELTDPIKNYADAINSAVTSSYVNTAVHVNNANGNSNVSDTVLIVSTQVTVDAWESVGPTATGADNAWTAMDGLPSGIDWIEAKIRASAAVGGTQVACLVYARDGQSSAGIGPENTVAEISYSDTVSNAKVVTTTVHVKIPVDSSKHFDIHWADSGSGTVTMYLTGYGYNG